MTPDSCIFHTQSTKIIYLMYPFFVISIFYQDDVINTFYQDVCLTTFLAKNLYIYILASPPPLWSSSLRATEWLSLGYCPQCERVCALSRSVMSDSFLAPQIVACQAPSSMGFSRKNTGVGCHFLLHGIF